MLNNTETTMATTTNNAVAGSGQHSHEVPSAVGQVVLMWDGNHNGTEVYRTQAGAFRFVSLDRNTVDTAPRCVLARLAGVSIEDVQEPYACDLDSPDGLALIGCDPGAEVPGEILWDSAAAPTAWAPGGAGAPPAPDASRYFGDWSSRQDVARDFEENDLPPDEDILFAWYSYEDYSGNAFVLFQKSDGLFEVNGGHCSCNGLEGQWGPKPTTWKALAMRPGITDDEYDGSAYGMDGEAKVALRALVSLHATAAPPPDGQDVARRRGDCFGPAGCDDCADCRIASGPCDEVHSAHDGQDVGKVR